MASAISKPAPRACRRWPCGPAASRAWCVDGETGILTPEGDLEAYAAALFRLIEDGGLRDRLGGAARRMVLEERSLAGAAAILADGLAGAPRRAPRRRPAPGMSEPWIAVEEQLDRARDAGRTLRFWLRDDDAVTVTPALERLRDLCVDVRNAGAAGRDSGRRRACPGILDRGQSLVHALPARLCSQQSRGRGRTAPASLAASARVGVVLEELRRGRARLQALFGARLSDILVPPWNRIDPALPPAPPGSGLRRRFRPSGRRRNRWTGYAHLNCDLDIIDWRNGRVGRSPEDVCGKLAGLIEQSRDSARPIGILTHHLAHDAQAWTFWRPCCSALRLIPRRISLTPAGLKKSIWLRCRREVRACRTRSCPS